MARPRRQGGSLQFPRGSLSAPLAGAPVGVELAERWGSLSAPSCVSAGWRIFIAISGKTVSSPNGSQVDLWRSCVIVSLLVVSRRVFGWRALFRGALLLLSPEEIGACPAFERIVYFLPVPFSRWMAYRHQERRP